MMARNVAQIPWGDYTESIPAFLVMLGIPLTHSIADGLSLGLVTYPIVKLLTGRRRDLGWTSITLALVLLGYFVFVRPMV